MRPPGSALRATGASRAGAPPPGTHGRGCRSTTRASLPCRTPGAPCTGGLPHCPQGTERPLLPQAHRLSCHSTWLPREPRRDLHSTISMPPTPPGPPPVNRSSSSASSLQYKLPWRLPGPEHFALPRQHCCTAHASPCAAGTQCRAGSARACIRGCELFSIARRVVREAREAASAPSAVPACSAVEVQLAGVPAEAAAKLLARVQAAAQVRVDGTGQRLCVLPASLADMKCCPVC